jgi:hypothetical protein
MNLNGAETGYSVLLIPFSSTAISRTPSETMDTKSTIYKL